MLTCTIPGLPQAQGSKRSLGPDRPFVESNKHLAAWRADAITFLQRAAAEHGWVRADGPVFVTAVFAYPRPKSHYRTGRFAGLLRDDAPTYKTSAPDLDKLQRALGDALTQAGIIRDDALIVRWYPVKVWGDEPGVSVHLEEAL